MQEILSKIDILKEHYQKVVKKLNPVLFNGQDFEKRKGPETNDQSLFRLQNKCRKISLLVMYYLIKFNDVIKSSFALFKNAF